jgi:CBS domain-containing protein
MSVARVMHGYPVACLADDLLCDAARIMWEHDCGFVPVVTSIEERRVIAVVTDRDICMCAYTRGADLRSLRVSDAMSSVVHSCRIDDTLQAAEALMQIAQVRRLPVLDYDGRLVGVLSVADIARRARQSVDDDVAGEPGKVEIGELISSISEPRVASTITADA